MKNNLCVLKKRVLSFLTVSAILIAIMPSGLFTFNAGAVESYGLKVGTVSVTSANCESYYTSNGWKYTPPTDDSPGILTLNGAVITGYSEYYTTDYGNNSIANGAGVYSENKLIINCIGASQIAPTVTGYSEISGIRCLSDVTFTGAAQLTVICPTAGLEAVGVNVREANAGSGSYKKMTVEDGANLNISTQNSGRTTAIKAHLHVYDATVNATAGNYTDGQGSSAGLRGRLFTYRNSSVVNIAAGNKSASGTELSSYGATDTLNIYSGTVSVLGYSYCASNNGNLFKYKYISVLVGSSASNCSEWDQTKNLSEYNYVKFQRGAYNVFVGSTRVTEDNSSDVLGDGKVAFELGEYDESSVITLNGAGLTSAYADATAYYGIYSEKALKITSNGTNSISTESYSGKANNYGVFSGETLEVDGSGQLTVTAGAATSKSNAFSGTSLKISGCSVTAYGNTKAFSAVPNISACPTPYILAGTSQAAAAEVDAASYTFSDKYVFLSPVTVQHYNVTNDNSAFSDQLVINTQCGISLSITADGASDSTYQWLRYEDTQGTWYPISTLVSAGLFPAGAFIGTDSKTLQINTNALEKRIYADGLYRCKVKTNGVSTYLYLKISLNHEDGTCVNTGNENTHSLTCNNCSMIDTQAHYKKWTVTREETETLSGRMVFVCPACGYTSSITSFTSASSENAAITLYGNGGTVGGAQSNILVPRSGILPKTYTTINIARLCTYALVREGYAFIGWAHSPNAEAPDYYAEDNMFVGENTMSLYAVWLHMPQREVSLSCVIPARCLLTSDVTAKLCYRGTVIKSFAFTDSISFDDIPQGTYELVVSKSGYISRKYPVTMGDTTISVDAELWQRGDASNDGVIDALDCMYAELAVSEHITPSEEQELYYDFDADTEISLFDFNEILNRSIGIE